MNFDLWIKKPGYLERGINRISISCTTTGIPYREQVGTTFRRCYLSGLMKGV